MGYQHELYIYDMNMKNARARCAYPWHRPTGCMVTITVRAIFSKLAWTFTRSFATAFAV